MSFGEIVVWPFAKLMLMFYGWTNNYGVAIMLFALVVNLVLLPFMAKSKKSMMRTTRLQPRLKELEKKHQGNQQEYQQAMMKLYKEEGYNPMSGCLWSLLPFPIIIALYSAIRQPLSRMMGLGSDAVEKITKWAAEYAGYTPSARSTYNEIAITDAIHQHWDAAKEALGTFGDKLIDLNYSFLGMNLGSTPDFRIWEYAGKDNFGAMLALFIIPVIAAFLSWASLKVSQINNPQPTGAAAGSMKSMNVFMPIMSVWICFMMPAALGVYWIVNSILGMARDYTLTKVYKHQLDIEDAERISKEKAREDEIQRKHEETERLRAEGNTTRNSNTSKKKMQAMQKQENDERKAAAEKAEREAKRARKGLSENETPASQVGNRRYARGRAYDPDRFGKQNAKEAKVEEAEAQ